MVTASLTTRSAVLREPDPFNATAMDGVSDGISPYPRACVATDRTRQRAAAPSCTADRAAPRGVLGSTRAAPRHDGDGVEDGAGPGRQRDHRPGPR